MSTRAVVAGVAVTAVVLAAAAAAAAGPGPEWQNVPRSSPGDRHVFGAAGRVWFVNGPLGGTISAKSARITGARLTGWVFATRPGAAGLSFTTLLGQDLVYETAGGDLRAMHLLPNGQLGQLSDIAGAPPPSSSTGTPLVRLRDRVIRIVSVGRGPYHLGVCCDSSGKPVSYPTIYYRVEGLQQEAWLGVDRHGRLWLTWWMGLGLASRHHVAMAELDPGTLRVRGKPKVVPVPRLRDDFPIGLACRETCRVLVIANQTAGPGGPFSWGPGEGSATRLSIPENDVAIGAADRGGRLEVAYQTVVRPPRYDTLTVGVARGDRRGLGLQTVSSIQYPLKGSPVGPFGVFGDRGFAVAGVYVSHVRAAILPG